MNPLTCGNKCNERSAVPVRCVEGCFCPEGKVKLNGDCVDPDRCDVCRYNGQAYKEGDVITKKEGNCTMKWYKASLFYFYISLVEYEDLSQF